MEEDHIPPEFEADAFHCPHCGAYANQSWDSIKFNGYISGKKIARCSRCGSDSLWAEKQLYYPKASTAPRPHEAMPEDVKRDFDEAREVVDSSPRAAAALLRLAIQRLLENHLETPGNGINSDIGHLIEEGRIDSRTKKMLDGVRITGNNSVHPGRMDMDDNMGMAVALFRVTNHIVDETIGRDKEIDEFWETLPEDDRQWVEERDGN